MSSSSSHPKKQTAKGDKLLRGAVHLGGPANSSPVPNVPVTVYEATAQEPSTVGTATTDTAGKFELHIERDKSERIFYAVATLAGGVEFVTIIGPTLETKSATDSDEHSAGNSPSITINELTTVAAAFSMAQFTQNGVIGGDAFGLHIASLMNDNLASSKSGASSEVLLSPPNGDETNSLRSTRSLANLLSSCVNNGQATANLFALTTPEGGAPPTSTFEAMVNIAHYPAQNVARIYTQSQAANTYSPALETMPDAWTIAVKVNDTGSKEHIFGGPGNIAFDKRGYAWISNNVIQGTPDSCRFAVVLKPNGKPADGTATTPSDGPDGLPKSPLFGGGLLGGGYGVDVSADGNVWFGNFGWGECEHCIPEGSVSLFRPDGVALSREPNGLIGGTHRVQAVVSDEHKNVWNASNGNSQVIVFLKGDPQKTLSAPGGEGYGPFGIALAADGSAWVTAGKNLLSGSDGSIARYKIDLENGKLDCVFSQRLGHGLKGLSVDSLGNIWIASGGDNVVYLFDREGNQIGTFGGGGIDGPWGATTDGDDNVWLANFGPMGKGSDYTNAAVSKLAGANPATRPPGFKTGDPISPPTGYTLPSAGAEVRLHNGEPLYGKGSAPCYCPLMRLTNCVIDQAGNVWAVNNWKPNFDTDFTSNPGGDGIVIFVGLAKPPKR